MRVQLNYPDGSKSAWEAPMTWDQAFPMLRRVEDDHDYKFRARHDRNGFSIDVATDAEAVLLRAVFS